jgi:hypothetical protein
LYGAGGGGGGEGGGAQSAGGVGAQGIIVVTYSFVPITGFNMPMLGM